MDNGRRQKFGAERTCTEWLLRNGACVKFVGEEKLFCDYNSLPPDTIPFTQKIKEIHGRDAGIITMGFSHLVGLDDVDLVHLEECKYINDESIEKLTTIKDTLKTLEIIGCKNVTDNGLLHAKKLIHLTNFKAQNLPYVKDASKVMQDLQGALPNCKLDFNV